jgi:hypothetical protein
MSQEQQYENGRVLRVSGPRKFITTARRSPSDSENVEILILLMD